ncbi:MAG: hypothetical protein F6K19_33875 [Cyanothece sp. SIO1E1]|nr:hypothetical protein [Cyanothece sp. SIO1E1]
MPAKHNRASIREYHLAYLTQTIGQQLGTDDLTEIVNHVIAEHKRAGIQVCCGSMPLVSTSQNPDRGEKMSMPAAIHPEVPNEAEVMDTLSAVFDQATRAA